MKVGIVGAGIAGLAAARTLSTANVECTLFEANSEVGGRCTTESVGDFVFDSGATSIAPRGRSLATVMFDELSQEGLVKIELPIFVHVFGRISPGGGEKNHMDRYTYVQGNVRLPKLLAEGMDVRLNQRIESLEQDSGGYRIQGEHFEALVLTPPLPQIDPMLQSIGESRPFANARYRPCLSVLLGYAQEIGPLHYHALIDPEQRHPLTWLSIESIKCTGRAPEGQCALVAQLSPDYSKNHFEADEATIVEEAVSHVERLYGPRFCDPAATHVRRWRYSQPETTALFDTVNRRGAKIMVASDGITGGRIEYSYDAGVRAAKTLLESL